MLKNKTTKLINFKDIKSVTRQNSQIFNAISYHQPILPIHYYFIHYAILFRINLPLKTLISSPWFAPYLRKIIDQACFLLCDNYIREQMEP